jgi:hypothetical protein
LGTATQTLKKKRLLLCANINFVLSISQEQEMSKGHVCPHF